MVANGLHRGGEVLADLVRQPPGEQLVEDDPQRVHVAARVEFQRIGQHLLGTHVGQRAQELPEIGVARGQGIGVGRARHAEIHDLGFAGLAHQDVARLQVPMDDAALVRVMNGFAHLRHEFELLAHAQAVLLGIAAQRHALDKLHREVRLRPEAGIGGARFVDLRDAGMMQAAQRLGLVLEAPQQLRAGQPGLDRLDRHAAAGLVLLGLVDRPHAPLAEQAENLNW